MLVASFSQHPGLCPQQLSLSAVLVLGLLFPLLLKLKIPQNTSSPLGFVCQGLAMGLPSAPQLQEGSKQGERRGQQEVSPVILREMVRCPQLQRYFPLIIGLKERCISKVTFCCNHQSPQTSLLWQTLFFAAHPGGVRSPKWDAPAPTELSPHPRALQRNRRKVLVPVWLQTGQETFQNVPYPNLGTLRCSFSDTRCQQNNKNDAEELCTRA